MNQSLWAPLHKAHSAVEPEAPHPLPTTTISDDLYKIQRLVDRLTWKSSLLLLSRERVSSNPNGPSMFKLDFFEFYTLLERLLVLLLASFRIPLGDSSVLHTITNGATIIGSRHRNLQHQHLQLQLQQQRLVAGHRYHENVLEAYEKEDNPLRAVLGEGEVKVHLKTAKELRNRWKEPQLQAPPQAHDEALIAKRCTDEYEDGTSALLSGEELSAMLFSILEALRQALNIAREQLLAGEPTDSTTRHAECANGCSVASHEEDTDVTMEDAPWETVADSMEWDLVW